MALAVLPAALGATATKAAAGAAGAGFLGTLGSVLGGVGQLAGGLGIGGSKKTSFKNMTSQYQMAHDWERKNFEQRVRMAGDVGKQYGISRLTLLGHQGAGASPYVSGTPSSGGFDPATIGQGLDRALTTSKNGTQRKLDELAIENAELSNDYLRVQIAGAARAVNRNAPPPVELVSDEQVISRKGDKGMTAGSHPAFMTYDIGKGRSMELPRSDEGPSEAIENLPFPLKQYKAAELYAKRIIPREFLPKKAYKYLKRKLKGN